MVMPRSNILIIENEKVWHNMLKTYIFEALSNINKDGNIIIAKNLDEAFLYLDSDTLWDLICADCINLCVGVKGKMITNWAITNSIPIIFLKKYDSQGTSNQQYPLLKKIKKPDENEFFKNNFDVIKFRNFIKNTFLLDNKTTTVFVCYSHKDFKAKERFDVFISPYKDTKDIDFWVDTRIKSGQDWLGEIEKAIMSAKIAVLLISADFLASDFIRKYELPTLLDKAKDDGTAILAVYLSPCDHESFGLSRFQFINPLNRPLNGEKRIQKESYWLDLTKRIRELAAAE